MPGSMADGRFVKVEITTGVTANVRVLSQHPDDDAARRDLYRASALWDWADKQIERATAEADPVKATTLVDQVVDAKVLRDKARRAAVQVALSQQHSGEEVERILRQCTDEMFLLLFNAAQGINPREVVADRLVRLVKQINLTPAEMLAVCYEPAQWQSLFTPPTENSAPTVT